MSLLLEALKKAERAKQEQAGASSGGTHPAEGETDLLLEPHRHPPREDRASPEAPDAAGLALEDLPAPAPAAARHATRGSEEATRDSAGNLFAAKRPGTRKGIVTAIAGVAVLLFAAGGWYVWQEMQPKGSLAGAPPASRPVPRPPAVAAGAVQPPAQPAPATLPAQPASATAQAAAAPGTVTAPPEPATGSPVAPGAVQAVPGASRAESGAPAGPRPAAAPVARRTPDSPAAAATETIPGVKIQRSPAAPRVDPATLAGYDAFVAGDLDAATRAYRAALQADPRNRDALLGMAAISGQTGRYAEAEDLYRRVLSLDPRDPVAAAGLMAVRAPADRTDAESRLKTLAVQQPDSAALQFALGNEYARQSRWSEAQHAYFRAHSLDQGSADIAFNLAVSLEHIDKPRLAAEYYQRAASLAGARPVGFDPAVAARRAQELAP